jgi:hypothetical protein
MKKVIYGLMAFSPMLALAASFTGIETLINQLQSILSKLVPLLFAVAIIYFFWGVIQFIRSAGDPKKAEEGKSIMIYGIIAIAVMASIYGLVAWIQNTLGVTETTINLPDLPTN